MARRSHRPPTTPRDTAVTIFLNPMMMAFLEMEAKQLSERTRRRVRVPDVVRALITSYYEKRVAGMVSSPDD